MKTNLKAELSKAKRKLKMANEDYQDTISTMLFLEVVQKNLKKKINSLSKQLINERK